MNLNKYQTQAIALSVYPSKFEVAYTSLGLIDEIGELLRVSTDDPDSLIAEMGDVCWYCAALANDLGLSLQECWDNSYIQVMDNVEALFLNATRLCGKAKKILRGDPDNKIKVNEIRGYIGDILRRLTFIIECYDSSLEEVCQRNLDKLFDRKNRGVLKGDGDKR